MSNNIYSENVIPSMNHLKQTPRFKQVDNYSSNNNKPCSARHNNDMRCNKAITPNKIILPKINRRKYRSSNTTNHTVPYTNINNDNIILFGVIALLQRISLLCLAEQGLLLLLL